MNGILSPLFASGAIGQLGAGLLSGRGTTGLSAGFQGANAALQGYQQQQQQQATVQGLLGGAGLSPQQQAVLSALPPQEAVGILSGQAFPEFDKDQVLLNALGGGDALRQAAEVDFGLRADAGEHLTAETSRRGQDVTARGQDISAETASNRLSLDERKYLSEDRRAGEKFRENQRQFGLEHAVREMRLDLDTRKVDIGVDQFGQTHGLAERRVNIDEDQFDRRLTFDNNKFELGFNADEAERASRLNIAERELEQAQVRIEQGDRSAEALEAHRAATLAVQQQNADTAQFRAENPSPGVVVNTGSSGFKVPKGFMVDPSDAGRVVPIPGSEQERARQDGELEREAALDNAREALSVIEKARSHPGRAFGTGVTGILPAIPGTAQGDFVRVNDQLQGKAFLQAFEALKGGGQITEIEGRKATEAIARLQRTQSEDGYLDALRDLENIIRAGIARSGRAGTSPLSVGQIRNMGNGVTIKRKN